MFTLLAADIADRFIIMLWPMIRISALLLVAPVLSISAVTLRIRIIFAFVLTWLIYPLLDWPRLDPTTAFGLIEVFNQAAIGLLMGLMLQIVSAALIVAGQAIAGSMGLAMASMMDPNFGNVPVIAQLLVIMGSLIFLGLGGASFALATAARELQALTDRHVIAKLGCAGASHCLVVDDVYGWRTSGLARFGYFARCQHWARCCDACGPLT